MSEIKADGVRRSVLQHLESLIDHEMLDQQILDHDVLSILLTYTEQLHREILIITNDQNHILHVGIGDASTAALDFEDDRFHIGLNRLRVIHTHPGGNPALSDHDFSAAKSFKLQCMIALGVHNGALTGISVAIPLVDENGLSYTETQFSSLENLNALNLKEHFAETNRALRIYEQRESEYAETGERALLLGIETAQNFMHMDLETSLNELARLAETAGATPVKRMMQNRPKNDPVFYVGSGKLKELAGIVQNSDINLIIANDELNANQIHAIASVTGCKTIDRTILILDIFARHATTREGKLQVELAQQKYRLSHLKGLGIMLSRTGGGIGTRGPGEKKLEIDRRHIRNQLHELEKKMTQIEKNNMLNAVRREKNNVRTVALVGYTNAGKSTLFNQLTESDAIIHDGLFVTLDSTLRKASPEYGKYLVSDTVGFIEKLPHDLVKAFKSTLKEVENADLLLHVVDASSPYLDNQMAVVHQVLNEIGAQRPVLTVYNKIDCLPEEEQSKIAHWNAQEAAVCISAKQRLGLSSLREKIDEMLNQLSTICQFLIPYADSAALTFFYDHSDVKSTDYVEDGTLITTEITPDFPLDRFKAFIVEEA